MAPIPQHRVDAPLQRQAVYPQVGIARWSEGLHAVEEAQPGGGIAGGGGHHKGCAGPVRQRAERPAVAVARVIGPTANKAVTLR